MTEGLTPGTESYQDARSAVNQKMFIATAYPGTAMFKEEKVQRALVEHFGITFHRSPGTLEWQPICDEAFQRYVLELDDATKVLADDAGNPLNFGEMPQDKFLQANEYVDTGRIEKILEM